MPVMGNAQKIPVLYVPSSGYVANLVAMTGFVLVEPISRWFGTTKLIPEAPESGSSRCWLMYVTFCTFDKWENQSDTLLPVLSARLVKISDIARLTSGSKALSSKLYPCIPSHVNMTRTDFCVHSTA